MEPEKPWRQRVSARFKDFLLKWYVCIVVQVPCGILCCLVVNFSWVPPAVFFPTLAREFETAVQWAPACCTVTDPDLVVLHISSPLKPSDYVNYTFERSDTVHLSSLVRKTVVCPVDPCPQGSTSQSFCTCWWMDMIKPKGEQFIDIRFQGGKRSMGTWATTAMCALRLSEGLVLGCVPAILTVSCLTFCLPRSSNLERQAWRQGITIPQTYSGRVLTGGSGQSGYA